LQLSSVSTKTEKPDPDACYAKPLSGPLTNLGGPHTTLGGRQPKIEPVTLDYIKSEVAAAGCGDSDRFIKPELLGGPETVAPSGHNGGPPPGASTACSGCGYGIHEEFILKVGEKSWHSQCLRQADTEASNNYLKIIYNF